MLSVCVTAPPCIPSRRLLIEGYPKAAYDLGSATSLGLLVWTVPGALAGSAWQAALATIGGE